MNIQDVHLTAIKSRNWTDQIFSAFLVKSVCLYFHIVKGKSREVFYRVVFWCAGIAVLDYSHFSLRKYVQAKFLMYEKMAKLLNLISFMYEQK